MCADNILGLCASLLSHKVYKSTGKCRYPFEWIGDEASEQTPHKLTVTCKSHPVSATPRSPFFWILEDVTELRIGISLISCRFADSCGLGVSWNFTYDTKYRLFKEFRHLFIPRLASSTCWLSQVAILEEGCSSLPGNRVILSMPRNKYPECLANHLARIGFQRNSVTQNSMPCSLCFFPSDMYSHGLGDVKVLSITKWRIKDTTSIEICGFI